MQANSKGSLSIATLWVFVEFLATRLLNLLFLAFLARLLSPEEFGTFALLAILYGVAAALVEGGLGLALIQDQSAEEADFSTVFWISTAISSGLAILFFLCAPLIAQVFSQNEIVELTYILALTVWIGGLGVVHRAVLVKRFAFGQIALINLTALVVSGVTAVCVARSGFGASSLAWQALASAFTTSALFWLTCGWRPRAVYKASSAKRLFSFGGYMLASTLLEVLYSKLYTVLIGKSYGAFELGHFSRAESSVQIVSGIVGFPLSRIAFPAFSKIDGDRQILKASLKAAIKFSMLVNSAAILTLVVVAEPFILTLFGYQWKLAADYLSILALSGLFFPLHVLNLQVLMALGKSKIFFRLEVIKKIAGTVILVCAAVSFGIEGLAWGIVLSGFISCIINSWFSQREVGYGTGQQLFDVIPALVIGSASAFSTSLAIHYSGFESDPIKLAVGIGISGVTLVVLTALAKVLGFDLVGVSVRALRGTNGMT